MSHLAKLSLSPASPRSEVSPLDSKRLKLLERLELQQQAAQAHINGEPFTEEVQRWVKHKDTGEKVLVTQQRSVKRWWWQNQTGQWMITLRDGNKLLPITEKKPSVEVGEKQALAQAFGLLIEAVKAGELDTCLKQAVASRMRQG